MIVYVCFSMCIILMVTLITICSLYSFKKDWQKPSPQLCSYEWKNTSTKTTLISYSTMSCFNITDLSKGRCSRITIQENTKDTKERCRKDKSLHVTAQDVEIIDLARYIFTITMPLTIFCSICFFSAGVIHYNAAVYTLFHTHKKDKCNSDNFLIKIKVVCGILHSLVILDIPCMLAVTYYNMPFIFLDEWFMWFNIALISVTASTLFFYGHSLTLNHLRKRQAHQPLVKKQRGNHSCAGIICCLCMYPIIAKLFCFFIVAITLIGLGFYLYKHSFFNLLT